MLEDGETEKRTDTLTAERAREVFDYDKLSGRLMWRIRQDVPREWNTRHAGKAAGSKVKLNSGAFYIQVRVDGILYLAHRVIWLHVTGQLPPFEIDHWDKDGTNNAWGNLREATRVQNLANRVVQKNSVSGIKGISRHGNRWRVRISSNGLLATETFVDLDDAKAWHSKMEKMLHGEFAPQSKSR